jgi:hypothetical protein
VEALVKGSLAQMARDNNKSLAQMWINVDAVILVDISGSMNSTDARGGKSRYDVAQEELAALQASLPGKLAIISFSYETQFVPSGNLPGTQGSTNLAGALKYARVADSIPDMRFIVISDGKPDDEYEALTEARLYKNRIDTVYVGPESGGGRAFLKKLAALNGGQTMVKPKLEELATGITYLLQG